MAGALKYRHIRILNMGEQIFTYISSQLTVALLTLSFSQFLDYYSHKFYIYLNRILMIMYMFLYDFLIPVIFYQLN